MKIAFCIFASFPLLFSAYAKKDKACTYAGSNLEYIATQTKIAIQAEQVEKSRYYAYKALNAFEKSKEQFKACGCDYINLYLREGSEDLKKATRVVSLNGTRILLERALESITEGLAMLQEHEEHAHSVYGNDLLAINTKNTLLNNSKPILPTRDVIEKKIDISLAKFEQSLKIVIKDVGCEEAYDFSKKIYLYSEKQLLKEGLSEAKKYYHLRTKQIAAKALEELRPCMNTVF